MNSSLECLSFGSEQESDGIHVICKASYFGAKFMACVSGMTFSYSRPC